MLLKLKHTLEMIKFSHSVFALPFALTGLFWATSGKPNLSVLIKIILAMVFARSSAMAFNRYVDASMDSLNPRTQFRHIPAHLLTKKFVLVFTVITAILFLITCFFINELSFQLAPVALGIIYFYSLTKRFTHLTQLALGLALGISPIAAWIAATGTFTETSLYLSAAVILWVAGFDIIYAIQDYEFDTKHNVGSMVVALGISKSLILSRVFHLITIVLLYLAGKSFGAGIFYTLGISAVSILFLYEHSLIKTNDLSKINIAFFNINGLIGFVFFIAVLLDLYL